jgi:hypothetical protein
MQPGPIASAEPAQHQPRQPLTICGVVVVVFGALGLVLSFIPIINNSVFVTPRAEMREKPFSFMECSALLY